MNGMSITQPCSAGGDDAETMTPTQSMILPNIDVSALMAMADEDGVLWRRDCDDDSDHFHLGTFLGFLYSLPVRPIDFEFSHDMWCGPGPAPSISVIELLADWRCLVEPLRAASMSFAVMIELQGSALGCSAPVLISPVLQQFRQTIAATIELGPVYAWLQQCDWAAILRGARLQDLAVCAVTAGHARVEGRSLEAVIRLCGARLL